MIVGDIFSAPAMHPGLLLTCAGCRGSRVLAVFDIELALSCVFSPPEILEFSTEHDCIYLHDELPRRRVGRLVLLWLKLQERLRWRRSND